MKFAGNVEVKGTITCQVDDDTAEQGMAVPLGYQVVIPLTRFPSDMVGIKSYRYTDDTIAMYQYYADSLTLRGLRNVTVNTNFLVFSDETKDNSIVLYNRVTANNGLKWDTGTVITIDKMNGSTTGSNDTMTYIDEGELKAGMSFLHGSTEPTSSEGNNGDIYFKVA